MKNKMRALAALLMVFCLALPVVSVQGAEQTVTNLELESAGLPSKLYIGEEQYTIKLWAMMTGTTTRVNVTAEAVWSSSNNASVKVDKGIITPLDESESVTITAKYKGYSASVDVSSAYRYKQVALQVQGESTAVPETLEVVMGDSLRLELKATAASDVQTDITSVANWKSSNTEVAAVSKGVITLKGIGTSTITADYGGREDKLVLSVKSPYAEIKLTPEDIHELKVGGPSKQLQAIAEKNSDGLTTNITASADWTSSNTAVVTAVKGKLVAVGPGVATVTAKSLGQSGSATIVVLAPFEGVRLVPEKPQYLTLQGGPVQIKMLAMNSETDAQDVSAMTEMKWTVADPYKASVRIDNGKAYIYPLNPGTTTIKGSYLGLTKELAVTIYPTVTDISLKKERMELLTDEKFALPGVIGTTLSGGSADVSGIAEWTSSDPSIVAFENEEWVIKQPGTVVLRAAVKNKSDDAPKTTDLELVIRKKVLMLVADEDIVSLVIGRNENLPQVTAWYEDGTSEDVTSRMSWKSSASVVIVTDTALKGIVPGKATLTGTYNNKTIRVITVAEEEYKSFKIEPKQLDLVVGRSKSIKVIGVTAKGKETVISARLNWQTEQDELASPNKTTIKATGEGSGKLTASYQGKVLEVPFVITAKLDKLVASDKSLALSSKAGSYQVQLTAMYNTGRTEQVAKDATWTSSKPKVATVTSKGLIQPLAKGTTTIRAKYEGKTVSITVKVQ